MLTRSEIGVVPADVHPLSDEEVRERQRRFGRNVLVPETRRGPLVWIVRFAFDPMVVLLLVAGITYLVLGDRFDGIVALAALAPIFLVTAVLESRSDRALAELKRLTEPTARVRRGMRDVVIDARDLVPGDLMLVQEGDVFPADGLLIGGDFLIVDESALTGESQPVVKDVGRGKILAGTALRSGRGEVVVTEIGASTKYGRIGRLMSEIHVTATPIERTIRRVVSQLGVIVLALCIAVIFVERGHGALWGAAVIAGVSLAMAALPEELPMVYTLYLALGAWRLAKDRALVRRLASVETLGSANVICVDKTGTLTTGRLELTETWSPSHDLALLLDAAVLASEARPFDPLDQALQHYARERGADVALLERERPLHTYPFDAAHRRVTKLWSRRNGVRIVTKGAPETILSLCAIDQAHRSAADAQAQRYAERGMRVIAVAEKESSAGGESREANERDLRLLGLLAFSDPVRADVPAAIAACARANIDVIMITGDHPATARAAASDLGIAAERVITGNELDAMHDDELIGALASARVFARIAPEQKLRIVQALHVRGDIVAMTGDGTNDALALREADIGVAMGQRGTEVARAAADLVLLDDNFTTIVAAIAGGRRIFRNLRRAFRYLNAFHLPLIVSGVVIPFAGVPLLLLPIHLVWLELIVHPTSALVYENDPGGAEDLMTQPPRGRHASLLRRGDWLRPVLLGATLSIACLLVYLLELRGGEPVEVARAAGLATMLVGQMLLVLAERSSNVAVWRQSLTDNPRLVPILAGTLGMILVMLYVPPIAHAFRIAPPTPQHFLLTSAVAAVATLWLEPFKRRHAQQ